jgi:chromosome segregation ATPase
MTAQISTLTTSILDARLALTRLRQSHPPPRLTIPGALARLDAQAESLQTLDDRLSALRREVSAAKEGVKEGGRQVEALRVERAEMSKTLREDGDEDESLVPIYDWCVLSFKLLL